MSSIEREKIKYLEKEVVSLRQIIWSIAYAAGGKIEVDDIIKALSASPKNYLSWEEKPEDRKFVIHATTIDELRKE